MDDYLEELLAGQAIPEEQKPETLKKLLEQHGSPRRGSEAEDAGAQKEDHEGEWLREGLEAATSARKGAEILGARIGEALEGRIAAALEGHITEPSGDPMADAFEGHTAEPSGVRMAEAWEEPAGGEKSSALEETANRRFLEELEREITSLSYGSADRVVIRQDQDTAAGEASTAGGTDNGAVLQPGSRTLSPEGLSRVFERDARRYP